MTNYLEEIRKRNLFISNNLNFLKGKKVFLRIDTNSAVTDGKLDLDSYKLYAHAQNLKKYISKGALPIIVTHQGRKGDEEFVENLEPIAKKMEELSGIRINYVDEIFGENLKKSIKNMKKGEAVFVKNIRDHPDETELKTMEEMARSPITQFFSKEADLFLNDGLSVCHRCQLSVVALTQMLPFYYGFIVETELEALQAVLNDLMNGKEVTFFVGGKKFEKLNYLEKILEYPGARFYTGGLIGQYIAHAAGIKMNDKNKKLLENSEIEIAKTLLNKFKDKIHYPTDYALDNGCTADKNNLCDTDGVVMDIGEETLDFYSKSINGRCVFAGVLGVFEKGFDNTLKLLRVAAGPNTIDLGGHSSAALFQDHGIYTYFTDKGGKVLTAGGAALSVLAGDKMPGLDVVLIKNNT